jgi:hypothetical protein
VAAEFPPPRLLPVAETADYLGVSVWTVREWVAAGLVTPVELPPRPPRNGERQRTRFRRLLFDRLALDAFIDRYTAATPEPLQLVGTLQAHRPNQSR